MHVRQASGRPLPDAGGGGGSDGAVYLSPRCTGPGFRPVGLVGPRQAYTTWQMLRKFARRNKAFTAAVVIALVLLAWSSAANYRARWETQRAYERLEERTQRAVPAR